MLHVWFIRAQQTLNTCRNVPRDRPCASSLISVGTFVAAGMEASLLQSTFVLLRPRAPVRTASSRQLRFPCASYCPERTPERLPTPSTCFGARSPTVESPLATQLRQIPPLEMRELQQSVSEDVLDAMRRTLSGMLGLLPSADWVVRLACREQIHAALQSTCCSMSLSCREFTHLHSKFVVVCARSPCRLSMPHWQG